MRDTELPPRVSFAEGDFDVRRTKGESDESGLRERDRDRGGMVKSAAGAAKRGQKNRDGGVSGWRALQRLEGFRFCRSDEVLIRVLLLSSILAKEGGMVNDRRREPQALSNGLPGSEGRSLDDAVKL